jgi:hypothetical protein
MEVLKESVSPAWVFGPLDIRSMLAFWMSSIRLASLELRLWFGVTFSWGHGGESHSPGFLMLCSLTGLDPKW